MNFDNITKKYVEVIVQLLNNIYPALDLSSRQIQVDRYREVINVC